MEKVVDIAEMEVSNSPEDILVTHSLGSCIGLSVYDPVAKVGGMLHYMLPMSKIDPEKAQTVPCMFADSGVPKLFAAIYKLGAAKERLIIRIAGGSQIMDDNQVFNIGKRNYMVLRKMFLKNGISIKAENVGGHVSRNLSLEIASGKCVVRSCGQEEEI